MNKIGLDDAQIQKPLLMQVIEGFISGEKSTSAFKQRVDSMLSEPQSQKAEKIQPQAQKKDSPVHDQDKPSKEENKAEKHLQIANQMLEEVSREEKTGYKAQFDSQTRYKESKKEELVETYNDDFDEEIDEDLPVDDLLESNDNQNRAGGSQGAGQSMGGITVSQSLGVDPSVDSLALEDYDHVEPVERLT